MTRPLGIDPHEDRLRIRALRAQPTGFATLDSERRRVFNAALGQFDELLTASAAVGPAARPLPLYYALNQAGRAIAAAKQKPGRPWEPLSHGLDVRDVNPHNLGQTKIWRSKPRKDGRDSFSILAEATDSRPLTRSGDTSRVTEETTLGRIWAAVPGAPRPGLGNGWPTAIELAVNDMAQAIVGGTIHQLQVAPTVDAREKIKAAIEDIYPAASRGLVVGNVINDLPPYRGTKAELTWHHPGTTDNDGPAKPMNRELFQYLWRGTGGGWFLLPRINKTEITWPDGHIERTSDTLTPLLLWWCLLHALSQIARYYSADWLAALDPDNSQTAVPIEELLTDALIVVPRLVLLELTSRDYPRPLAARS